ncbi:MAG: right-handed parallel beta-helix repeat-containing protein, partial [Phycisphaerae bacterium]
ARDLALYETILSGDLNGDDLPGFANRADNAYHVVVAVNVDDTAILDGVTVRGGQADGPNFGASPDSKDQGSGVNIYWSTPRLIQCTITDNWADNHGSVNDHGGATIIGCTFEGNATGNVAGGLYMHFDMDTVVTDCQFLNNTTANKGGGAYNKGSTTSAFTNCLFQGNTAGNGGGMYCDNASNPTLTNCTFVNNEALKGGGLYSQNASSPTLVDCTFDANQAVGAAGSTDRRGGGMYNQGVTPQLTDCTFTGNHAFHGSGIYNTGTNLTVTGCTFTNNIGATACDVNPLNCPGGGGIYAIDGTTLTITDTLFSGNGVNRKGGTLYVDLGSALMMDGCAIGGSFSYYGSTYVKASTVDVRDCTFSGNSGNWAGGINFFSSVGHVTGCTFFDNQAGSGAGGAIRATLSTVDIVNSRFLENHVLSQMGGAIDAFGSNLAISNTIFNGNVASTQGGALNLAPGTTVDQVTVLSNCTIVNNTAPLGTSIAMVDMFPDAANLLTLNNSIVWPISGAPIWSDGDPPVISIAHSDIKGGWAGTGNIDQVPGFIDADGFDNVLGTSDDDLRLSPDSPCVNTGNNALLPPDTTDLDGDGNTSETVPFDLDESPRIAGMTVDMGVYEQSDCNGNGILDIQDIADGTSSDCNNNQLPDECEPDCNANGTADPCELDSDGDGAIDACDGCPNDVNKTAPGACGCGVSEVDSDADSVPDCNDICAGFDDLVDTDGDGVPDGCDTCNGADDTIDCNHNAVADPCEILEGLVADNDGNGIPDVCDIAPVASGVGGRYLRATPVPAAEPVALRVSSPNDHPCLLRWVSPDGLLINTPVFLLPEQWGSIGIHGSEIRPSSTYEIVADYLGGMSSVSVVAATAAWGDVNGDGIANFGDIQLQVLAFQGDFSGAELEAMDLDPCVPNGVVNFSDVQKGVLAFQGGSFADTACPPPCP